ncbi:hypothetical protein GX563_08710 [Candidatus Bathyarchaeota archaeon]|nr:hypothetical protein [Candidatus Bathyarchaeota archaeon]
MLKQVFRCPICRKSFGDPEKLRLHRVNRHHGTVYGDNWLTPQKVVVSKVQSQGHL